MTDEYKKLQKNVLKQIILENECKNKNIARTL